MDAVLVRDPAVLALRPHYPELEFHFSTQTCMANSADVAAAGRLGARRVVLARELSLDEIAAASAVGVETEVFVQGALCFCVSGRCLLSSWAGGRSGNRGACTSPCRVPWNVADQAAGTPLSMRDLSTVHRLEDLRKAGVVSLKIEGRLKSAAWVGQAVSLYRRALDGENPQPLLEQAGQLGAYTGRLLTCGYLDGQRNELTALAGGRVAASSVVQSPGPQEASEAEGEDDERPTYDLDISVGEKGIVCRCCCNGRSAEWTLPKTVVRREKKAVSVAQILAHLPKLEIQGCRPGKLTTNDEQYLLVPRASNALIDRLSPTLHQLRKQDENELVRIDLPAAVRGVLEKTLAHPANRLALGQHPDRVRLHVRAVDAFFRQIRSQGSHQARPGGVIVEGVSADGVEKVREVCDTTPLMVALPAVFFENDVAQVRSLLSECKRVGVGVEVNSWGGWELRARRE